MISVKVLVLYNYNGRLTLHNKKIMRVIGENNYVFSCKTLSFCVFNKSAEIKIYNIGQNYNTINVYYQKYLI